MTAKWRCQVMTMACVWAIWTLCVGLPARGAQTSDEPMVIADELTELPQGETPKTEEPPQSESPKADPKVEPTSKSEPEQPATQGVSEAEADAPEASERENPVSVALASEPVEPPILHTPGISLHHGLPHLGCATCAKCTGPHCPYHEAQPSLAQKRAEVASQFLDFARPTSILRFHGDQWFNVEHPDRATYLWGRAGIENASPNAPDPGTPGAEEESVNFHHLSIYMETASSKKASAFFEFQLTGVDPDRNHDRTSIGDLAFGTKAVFCDKSDFLATFQFKTYIPTGKEMTGNGNGHVSLEPGVLTSWQLAPRTFLQNQASLWIPLGGDPNLKGELVKYGASLNWIAWEHAHKSKALITTFELIGWVTLSGEFFSIEDDRNHPADGNSIMNIGPGLRYILTEKCEIGAGANVNVTNDQWQDWGYQIEFRWFF